MCKNSDCKQVNVSVSLGCCADEQTNDKCENIVVPYGNKTVYRCEANKDAGGCEPLAGDIWIGYHNGTWGTYRQVDENNVDIIKQTNNS